MADRDCPNAWTIHRTGGGRGNTQRLKAKRNDRGRRLPTQPIAGYSGAGFDGLYIVLLALVVFTHRGGTLKIN